MALQAAQIADLITVTLRDLGRLKFTEIASTLTDYVALPNILQKYKVQYQSGHGIQWNVMFAQSDAAKNVGLYESDNVNIADIMTTANIPWRHCTTNYAFERREIQMNSNPARIVELVKTRRADAMLSLAELMETNLWTSPSASSDNLKPLGIPHWIVPPTDGQEGFLGKNPTGFSDGAGGINSDLEKFSGWRNYVADYDQINKTDLIRKWRKAAVFTNFKSPVPHASYNTGNNYGYYTNYAVIGRLEEVLEAQNDNLGNDVASKDGLLQFRQNPVVYVPKLDAETTNPIYGINWGVLKPVFLSGEWMKEEGPNTVPGQHTTFQVFVDCTLNYMCTDRRRLFRLETV
jgi:hypothetical protein